MASSNAMENILEMLNLRHLQRAFQAEKITPDLICKLSMSEMHYLGATNSSDIMRLRTECIKYAPIAPASRSRDSPKFEISRELLESLIDSGFMIKEISKLLSVSNSTVYRRMRMYNLSVLEFTTIDDDALKEKMGAILSEYLRCGETMMRHILKEYGFKITRSRLREVLHSIDKCGIKERQRRRLHRRVYSVMAPNHLWHVDTNHKLIRWRFIIAGAVDGFSRLIVFLECLNNNRAETLQRCFMSAVEKYGTPLRVRCDQGLENLRIAEYMLQVRGGTPASIIAGKSTHNQRIERLWRDVYEGVLSYYYDLFYFMEEEGILDALSDLHLYTLHYVFIRKINVKLGIWSNAWANHRMRTTKSSPLRLFTAGEMILSVEQPLVDHEETFDGENDDVDTHGENQRPVLYPSLFEVNDACKEQLMLQCPQNWVSENHGIDIFLQALDIINRY